MTDHSANEYGREPGAPALQTAGAHMRRLSPPAIRLPTIHRELVLRSLATARAGRMSLVVAPAGFGKTTVLTQWHAQLIAQGVTAAWYTAAERDRDPAAFLRMVGRAAHLAGVDMRASGVLEGSAGSVDVTLDALLLALDLHPGDVVLILDEYDRIESDEITDLVEAVVQTSSDKTHVVLAGRRKPRLAVSALLAQGGARVFEANELRMSPGELADMLQLPADSTEVEAIAEFTQGWPATVELYRLWRQKAQDTDTLAGLAAGQPAEVADYLAEQVFAFLSPDLQGLLNDISRLGEIEVDLVNAVRRRSDSADLLEDLSRTLPGLVQNTSAAPQTYQVHPLLLDYARLRSGMDGTRGRSIHLRASGWFEQRRRYEEAVEHATAARDAEALDTLLARLKPLHIFLNGGATELRAILRRAPPDRISAHPRLELMAALAHLKSGFFAEAAAMVEKVREKTSDFRLDPYGGGAQLALEAYAVKLILAGYLDGAAAPAEALSAAIVALATDDPIMWAWCENIMIVIHQQRGEFLTCSNAIARTRALYDSSGMALFAETQVPIHEMLLALGQGHLRQAADVAAAARQLRRLPSSLGAPVMGVSRIVLSVVDYERRFSDMTVDLARTALDALGEAETWAEPAMVVYAPAAELAVRRDGAAGLRRLVEDIGARARRTGMRSLEIFTTATEVAGLVRLGEPAQAEAGMRRLEEARRRWAAGAPSSWRERDSGALALTLWRMATSDLDGAVAEADAMAQAGAQEGRLRTQIKGLVLKALALEAQERREQALDALSAALNLAQTQSFVAVFAEEGLALQALLDEIVKAEQTPQTVRRQAEIVSKALDLGRRRHDELNEREAEILAHLIEGASNKLIARRMGVTDNTIKFHLKKIFAKLGVTSRKAAAAAARDAA